jgi:hypothetical protein
LDLTYRQRGCVLFCDIWEHSELDSRFSWANRTSFDSAALRLRMTHLRGVDGRYEGASVLWDVATACAKVLGILTSTSRSDDTLEWQRETVRVALPLRFQWEIRARAFVAVRRRCGVPRLRALRSARNDTPLDPLYFFPIPPCRPSILLFSPAFSILLFSVLLIAFLPLLTAFVLCL